MNQVIVDEQYKTFDPQHERHFLDMCFKQIAEAENNIKSTHSCELKNISLVLVNTCKQLQLLCP